MKEIAIGIDIGGTFTKFGFVDKSGEVLAAGSIPTTGYADVEAFQDTLKEALDEKQDTIPHSINIMGVGIGAPNGNYYSGTIEQAPNLSWKGVVPFVKLFKRHFDLPMALTNDANAAAIGEMVYGGAKNMRDFIVITLGTGLGSGLVVNGQLVYGHDGFAGELGHITIEKEGRMLPTGRRGSLEAYVSATGIKRTAFHLMAEMIVNSELRDISYNNLSAKMVYDAALKGDELALEAFERTGKYLGEALANTVMHTSPEAIFIFGGLASAGEYILNPTKKYMEDNLLPIFKNKVKILPSGLTEANAAVLGASALVWQEISE